MLNVSTTNASELNIQYDDTENQLGDFNSVISFSNVQLDKKSS